VILIGKPAGCVTPLLAFMANVVEVDTVELQNAKMVCSLTKNMILPQEFVFFKLKCYAKDSGYSQCLRSCDPVWQAGWECLNSNTVGVTSTNSFPGCQFRFGMQFKNKDTDYSTVDYIGIWIGDDPMLYFNQYWHGDMLRTCVNKKKLPVFYGYIIAFMARYENLLL
jgi:hypothetical protein